MSPSILQRPVGTSPGLIIGAGSGTVQVINLSTTATAYLGYDTSITPGGLNVLPLGPLACATVEASTAAVYAIGNAACTLAIVPGGTDYAPGSLTINGPVTAEISGPVTVEGTIDIGNTPTVDLAAGATVDIGGTADVNVQNATIDVIGSGGFMLAGELALLLNNTAQITATPTVTGSRGPFSVGNFSSILFSAANPSNSSAATGAAVCAMWQFSWFDAGGNLIATDVISSLIGCNITVQIPVKGSSLTITLVNNGSVGTITYAVSTVKLWGDYRSIADVTVMEYLITTVPVITGWTFLPPGNPVSGIARWIASLNQTETASTQYLLPLPLWNGPVSGWYQQITQALANNATLVDLTYAVQGSIPAGTAYAFGILANLPSAIASAPVEVSYYSPPTQLAFLFKGGATSGGQTFLNLTGSA